MATEPQTFTELIADWPRVTSADIARIQRKGQEMRAAEMARLVRAGGVGLARLAGAIVRQAEALTENIPIHTRHGKA
jgi:hypothetical protein